MSLYTALNHWLHSVYSRDRHHDGGPCIAAYRAQLQRAGVGLDAFLDDIRRHEGTHELRALSCGDVMSRPLATVRHDTSIGVALDLLRRHHLDVLPVLSPYADVAGIVTRRELMHEPVVYAHSHCPYARTVRPPKKISPYHPVFSVMSTDFDAICAEDPLTHVIELFRARGVRNLPVLDHHSHVVGMVTEADIFFAMTGRRFA
jgi:CBS-domain-containing membrane protein